MTNNKVLTIVKGEEFKVNIKNEIDKEEKEKAMISFINAVYNLIRRTSDYSI